MKAYHQKRSWAGWSQIYYFIALLCLAEPQLTCFKCTFISLHMAGCMELWLAVVVLVTLITVAQVWCGTTPAQCVVRMVR